jgi:hypothetical protein
MKSKRTKLTEPWNTFLREIDRQLEHEIVIHCLGGFVLAALFDLPRPTADIDYVAAAPANRSPELLTLAGAGTPLAKQHGLYVQFVTVADLPDDYEDRLIDITPRSLSKLRLRALSPEDLLLAKLTRNSPKDIYDVRFLAEHGAVDPNLFRKLYRDHLRPYLVNTEKHDLTADLWLEEIEGASQQGTSR